MNIRNVIIVRDMLQKGYSAFDTLEESAGRPREINMPLKEVFKLDVMRVVLYLAAADGKMASDEAEFINNVFDMNNSVTDYIKLINECNIYSTEFETSGLPSFDILHTVDEKTGLNGVESMMLILENVAKAICLSDDEASEQEVKEYKAYFANLKRRYNQCENGLLKKNAGSNPVSNNSLKEYYLKKKM